MIDWHQFQQFVDLLEPLIEIKNWKAQTPFPTDIKTVLRSFVQLKQCTLPSPPLSGEPARLFCTFVNQQGFGLPTASAVFHFCHPCSFPIVDANVMNACRILDRDCPSEFVGLKMPNMPAQYATPDSKLMKYQHFIAFIDPVVQLQRNQYGGSPDYRFVDKALMVFEACPRHVRPLLANVGGPSAFHGKGKLSQVSAEPHGAEPGAPASNYSHACSSRSFSIFINS